LPRRGRRGARRRRVAFLISSALGLSVASLANGAPVSASEVVSYVPGTAREDYRNASAALGLPAGDTTFGALTPFNPPFSNNHVVIVGPGGELTLRLSAPVAPVPGVATPELGVFVNNGLVDVSPGGTGTAGNPASTFSPAPAARVSVSDDGSRFVPLAGGPLDLVTFSNPTNFYTDTHIDNYSAPLGNQPADFSRPFTGNLSSFDGLTYEQMLGVLNGSAGGNWLDLSGTGLSSVQLVRFEVPEGSDARLVLDALTAVPEPGAACVALAPLAAVLLGRVRRRRH
jgi:hypothetical protein